MKLPKDTVGLLEGIASARSIHRFEPDPIPDDDLAAILYGATRAPSGSNRQPFRFLVLRDGPRAREAKALLGEAFRKGWTAKSAHEGWEGKDVSPRRRRSAAAMQHFVDHFEEIPVIVLACMLRYRDENALEGASIFPACQNLLLAARALGYGAVFSMWHAFVEADLRRLLSIPDEAFIAATIPVGKPVGGHGPLRRRPVRELVFDDTWEGLAEWIDDPPGSRLSRSRGPSR